MNVATARVFVLRTVVACALVSSAAVLGTGSALAQGVTTSGIRGVVTDEAGQPVVGATIVLTGRLTGQRFQGVTQAGGRYYLTNVPVGPYIVESRAIGYRPARNDGISLALNQTTEANLRMQSAAVELAAITTVAEQRGLDPMSVDRTGASSLVSDTMMRNLPSLTRNFTDFIATVPQVVGGIGSGGPSVGGTNNRYNNIQIDGSVNNDLFGLAGSGTPGGQADAKAISIEAIREFQVLIAPFDVRQGGFTGGLVNAITQSGTNRWHGSLFGFRQSDELVGKDSAGNKQANFTQTQYGFTLGGPLLRDRLHFFTAIETQSKDTPFAGQLISNDTTGGKDSIGVGIRRYTAERVSQFASTSLGFDPGGIAAPAIQTPSTNIFAKLSWQPSTNNTVDFSYNRVTGSDGKLTRNSTATGNRDGYQLSSSGYDQANVTNTLRAIWTRPFGSRINNEFILAYQTIRDHREMPSQQPLMLVGGDRGQPVAATAVPTTNIAIGGERFSHGNQLDQNIFEFTDNLTWNVNSVHTLTLGTHNELFNFYNVFYPAKFGIWNFRDTTSFIAGTPYRYEIALPGANGIGPIADFGVKQFGFYAQDVITPNRRLTLNIGLRVDLPNLDRPNYNPNLDTTAAALIVTGPNIGQHLGINTRDNYPASNALWSPRFGFNLDVNGNGNTLLRGGIGVFSGRPPYVWVSNSFVNTGMEQVTLVCDAALTSSGGLLDSVPAFTNDVTNLPTACGGTAAAAATASSIVYYDQNFKFPQTGRLALGVDRRLPWNMVGTVDFVYSRWLNSFYLTDVNLLAGGISTGEGNRQLYGTPGTATSATNTPARLTSQAATNLIQFRDIIRQSNASRDYSYQLTFQLQKRFSDGLEFNAGYTYARSYDLISMTSSISNSNLRFATLDGTLEDRNLRPAVFDVPHKVSLSVTGNLPWRISGSLIYVGRSGTPYGYIVSNDVNGDGLGGNDMVYVPANAQDIQLCPLTGACTSTSQDPAAYARLDTYINQEPCLRGNRGSLLARNSCRNPWQSYVNARLAKGIPTLRGQHIDITADIFNLLSFLGIGGKVKETSTFEGANLLSLNRYNAAAKRGVYTLALPTYQRVNSTASRWRLLLGLRYSF